MGPALGAIAAAAAVATGTARLNEIRSQRFAFAEGGIVPGVGNKDTVPALLTPGEVVIPKSNFEDLQKNLQGGVTADQIVLLQQSNEIQAKILDTITFGTVNDKLTQIIAGLSRVADRVDAISLNSGSNGTVETPVTPAEPPQVPAPPPPDPGPGRISPSRNRERELQKSRARDI